jgi:hypothetical protein
MVPKNHANLQGWRVVNDVYSVHFAIRVGELRE